MQDREAGFAAVWIGEGGVGVDGERECGGERDGAAGDIYELGKGGGVWRRGGLMWWWLVVVLSCFSLSCVVLACGWMGERGIRESER